MNVPGLANRDKVLLARVAAKDYRAAEAIYNALEQEQRLAPNGKVIGSQLVALAQVDPGGARKLAEHLLQGTVSKATADGIMADLGHILRVDAGVAAALMNTHSGHRAALTQLSALAQTITNGTAVRPQADQILNLAKTNPGTGQQLAQLAMSGANGAGAVVNKVLQLPAGANVSNATLNRLAHIANTNPHVGNTLADLSQAAHGGQLTFDPGIIDRLAMHVRQTGVPAHGTNPTAVDSNRALINGFRALLTAEYGATIANNVFAAHVQAIHTAGTPLNVATIQNAVQAARAAQDNAIFVGLNGGVAAQLPEARRQAALRAFTEVERAGGFPDRERAQLYKPELLRVLETVAESAFNIDGTVDGSLLTKIATQVAKKEFDDKVLVGVRDHLRATGQCNWMVEGTKLIPIRNPPATWSMLAWRPCGRRTRRSITS